tara:strand:+ start:24758 stop:26548 length:1791 start_codon:yes stop_codon:yes gene_type:complete
MTKTNGSANKSGLVTKLYAWVAVPMLLASANVVATSGSERVENFRLMDQSGGSHELHYFADAPAIVLMAHSAQCEATADNVAQLNALQATYREQGVEFLLINSDLGDAPAQLSDNASQVPILLDRTQLIGESLRLRQAGETLIIDPATWHYVYRGDAAGADVILRKLVGGQNSLSGELSAQGLGPVAAELAASTDCALAFPELARREQHARISYSDDIAPILMEKCVSCHRPGGIGPWAMSNYNMVRGFAPMIREVVRTQRMPPWHADPHYGEFSNNRGLSDAQTRTLVHWIEAGAPRGEGADALAMQQTNWPQWSLGEPDVIIEIPAEDVPASGVVDYKYKMVNNPLQEDVWVRATEIIPGDRTVLHHVITTFGELETSGRRTGRLKRGSGGSLGGYVPGGNGRPYPDNTGVLLPAGSTIEFQMHYTTAGRATTDVSHLGIYLYDVAPQHELQSMTLLNPRIRIPAGAANHEESVARMVQDDILVYTLLPHAHYRGKASEFVAEYPDGSSEKLLSVPRYDFNWQTTYELTEPKFLPAGTRIVHRTWWDNSARNPANPDPNREVPWGQQSWDEMLFGAITYRVLPTTGEEQAAGGQ